MHFPTMIFLYAAILFADSIIFSILAVEKNIAILTPAFFAGIIFLMGLVTLKKDFQLFGKHGATALSLIAFLSNVSSFLDISSESISYAAYSKATAAMISLVFLIFAVKKIGDERRQKENQNGTE